MASSGEALQGLGDALQDALARVRGLDDLYDLTCGVLRHHLGSDVRLSLYEERAGRVWLRAQRGYAETTNSHLLGDDLISQALRTGRPIRSHSVAIPPDDVGIDARALFVAPFITARRRGAIVLSAQEPLGDAVADAANAAMRVVEQALSALPASDLDELTGPRWLSLAFLRLANTRDRDALCELTARLVGEVLGVDAVQVAEGADDLTIVATWHADDDRSCALTEADIGAAVARSRGDQFRLRADRSDAGGCDVIGLPLRAAGELLGFVVASASKRLDPSAEALEQAELLTAHAASALITLGMLERSERAAVTDGLTGLWNHRRFYETSLALIEAAPEVEFALVLADLDDFKELNDRQGHVAGDDALRAVAGVLRRGMRPGDSVFRIGGEEFALLLPSTSRPNARTVCRRLQRTLEGLDLGGWRLTLSFGVARCPDDGSDLRTLMQAADAALYEAKRLGKDRITMASERLVARRSPTMKARTRRGFEQMRQLEALVVRLGAARTPHTVSRELLAGLREVVPGAHAVVWALEGGRFSGAVLAGSVDDPAVERGLRELGAAALLEGRTRLRDDDPESIPPSALVAPLGTPPLAVLAVAAHEDAPFDRDDLRLVEVAARVAGLALSNALRVVPAVEHIGAPGSLAVAISRCDSLEEMGRTVCEHTAARVRADRFSVWQRLDANRSELVYVIGVDEALVRRHRLTEALAWRAPGVPGVVLMEGGPSEYALEGVPYTPDSLLAVVPIALDNRTLGSLCVVRLTGLPFRQDEISLLEDIAAQTALALHAFRSTELAEAELLATIESLVSALEVQDPATSRHALAIVELAVGVGRRLGLAPAALRRLEHGAALHDIGKIGVASELLRKPAPLDEQETLAMRCHPELGARILEPVARLRDVAPIVRASHERYDGTGYPDGVAGEAIPLEARIVAVCDAFDAMVSDRPYRGAMSREAATAELRAGAGSQFDPQVVHAFIEELAYMHREAS
jgi:diguanylate cyclase (GGDEF)-like protein